MPVRLKIALLFSVIVFCILGVSGSIIYYYSAINRRNYIDTRLTNMAITTGRFLSRSETFSPKLIQKIDSLTAIAFTRKTVQAYDQLNRKIYSFNDDDTDTLNISAKTLNHVRDKKKTYLVIGNRDVVIYHYKDDNISIVLVAAGYDISGRRNLQQLLFILLISFIAGNVIAVISGFVFSKRLLKPLSKIADDVNEISAQNLAKRLDTGSSRDEWFYLSDTLNQLLNRLQESFELQRRFISNASHELSTPLTSISSQLEVSLQKERSAEDYRKVMESIYEDIQQMGKLTHTLLQFAKASGNKGGIDINPVRMDEVVLRLPSELVKIDTKYSVNLRFEKLPENQENLLVYGNEELLFTAIKNIVVNACKYSQDQQATLLLSSDNENINISIRNTGPGIPPKELENIFQPFYRVEESRTAGGFGLGLSLAQRIIKLHRGNITVQSNPGGETFFTVYLPSAKHLT
jgi:two-component system sensor histidine kinase ArlS